MLIFYSPFWGVKITLMGKIPTPQQCGLPPKFDIWRANQESAIESMQTSTRRVTALSAPTGFGKSPAYIAYALLSGQPTCIVTNSRGLQDQLMRDYASIGLVDIRGRANYQCEMREDYSCQEGYVARCPYKGSVGCPASKAEMDASASKLVVTNYAKWTSDTRTTPGLLHIKQVVFDEGHDAPDAVASAMRVTLSPNEIENDLELEYPIDLDTFGCWKHWAAHAGPVAEQKLKDLKHKMTLVVEPKSSWVRQIFHYRSLIKKLATIACARPEDWVVEEVNNEFVFDPIRPARYSEAVLLLHVPRIIIVSATLRPKTLSMLGIDKNSYDFHEFNSDFDPQRCPIYYIPTMRVDARAKDLGMLWVRLDQIISRRRDRKGIIHTISYARRDDILARSRYANSMMINAKGVPATSMVEVFKAAGPGTILISPSVGTGYDFPGKDCEWQFICKIPFPDGRSKIIKARQEDDKEFGPYGAMQSMVQAFGRGTRSKEDQCENFIGDEHLDWFLPKYRHLAPKSFHQFFRRVETLPQPPLPLGE